MGVTTECRDSSGKLKWQDNVSKYVMPDPRPIMPMSLKPAFLILLIVSTCLLCYMYPAIGWLLPVFTRVTTVGLNAILNSTLCNSITSASWYAGLMKQVASDGAITSGTAAFTSASGTFVAGDIGRNIIVQGAGAAGVDLYTTILAVGSATSITLAANAGTTVSAARYAFECRLADTMASHTSFVESTSYSNVSRVTWTPGAPAGGSVDNSASVAAFSVNATDWIFGAFLVSNNTKGGTTGTLYGAGVNSSGIARQVVNGDTLNVTITCTVTST
jgi:hypothetical protein